MSKILIRDCNFKEEMRRKCNSVFVETPSASNNENMNPDSNTIRALVKYRKDEDDKYTYMNFKLDTIVAVIEMEIRDTLYRNYDSVDVEIQYNNGEKLYLNDHRAKSLSDLKITSSGENFIVSAMPPQFDRRLNMSLDVAGSNNSDQVGPVEDDLLLGASASPTTGDIPSTEVPPVPEDDSGVIFRRRRAVTMEEEEEDDEDSCIGNVAATLSPLTNDAVVEQQQQQQSTSNNVETMKYVGLVNQAMTCYLNSLVQALFMTPEFRNAIYNWEFDGINETRSIPYQLQKLFLNLQTSTRSAVETTDLTTSFGWQGSDAWHQHDIQELCRVMFDALERKFKSTKQANLINDLYEGTMLDYVKCLECGTEKSREDTFLDIPLPVRPFGSAVAYNSVEEALRGFVQPETLDGNNQYHCEKCNKKCDAHKGLKFIKFPYLLTLHLKRFDFDYNTMHRIKLNDKVVFPEVLNLNSFVPNSRNTSDLDDGNDHIINNKCDDCSTTDSGSALDDESCHDITTTTATAAVQNNDTNDNCEDSDEGIDMSSGNTHEGNPKGPYNYELFSIMIHSGSASGGHYYAYIKDFDKNQWLCFNDQSVNRITDEDLKKTYGGGPQKGYYSGMYTSSTNAYMLMYRQIDKLRNCTAMKPDEFPPHVEKLLQSMRDKEKFDRLNKEKQNNSFRLTVHCNNGGEMMDVRLNLFSDSTLEDAVAMAHRRFKLNDDVDLDDCRMVVYNKKHACIDCSFDSLDIKFCDIVDKWKVFHSDWLLDIKEPGTEFEQFKKGGINMRVYSVNIETEDVKEPVLVRVDVGDTVKMLKVKLATLLDITDADSINVAIVKFCNDPQYLDDDSIIVPFDDITCPEFKLYITTTQIFNNNNNNNALDVEDVAKKFEQSKFKKIIDRFECVICLDILLPDTDPATLDSLFIPTLDINCQNSDKLETDRDNSNLRISPQPPVTIHDAFGDQSNSEDSSLSDSDRTLVGDAPGECQNLFSSSSNSPGDQHMTSPSDPTEDIYDYNVMGNPAGTDELMNWDSGTIMMNNLPKHVNYFKVTSIRDCTKQRKRNLTKLLRVLVDSRMTLDTFKKCLEPVIKVPKEYFKIYRPYPTSDEEWSTLSDTLRMTRDGQQLTVKLGRALSANEFNCRVYLLRADSTDTNHFLFEHILQRGQSVAQVKKEILLKMKKQHMLDIAFNKCRLREKCMKKPRKVYLDDQFFDTVVVNSYEIFLQELVNGENVTSCNQMVLFVRQWCPSTLTLAPFQEVVLNSPTMPELKTKLSELSGLPIDFIEVAFVRNIFPCDMHLLDIHAELDWDPHVTHLDQWPLQVDDGSALFYRDNREVLKELTAEERKEINLKENTRLGRVSTKNSSSGEKSLRIYTDNWPSEEDNCIE